MLGDLRDVARWRAAGLLDPVGSERFDELDLVRESAIRHGEANGVVQCNILHGGWPYKVRGTQLFVIARRRNTLGIRRIMFAVDDSDDVGRPLPC